MTGRPLPEGADAVVPVEQTELIDADNGAAAASRSVARASTCCRSALRCALATSCCEAGRHRCVRSKSRILAEIGHGAVAVLPRPRVAMLPTGNELVAVGEKPGAGQIRNSNGPMLVAAGHARRRRRDRTRHRARRRDELHDD